MASDLSANGVVDGAKRIPPAGWAVILGGGALLGLYLRFRSKAAPVSVGDAAATDGSTGPDPRTGQTIVTPISQTPVATQAAKPTTNLEWITQALDYAISKGADPGVSASALHKFAVTGDPLDTQESAIVREVIRQFGEPPEGIPNPTFTQQPVPLPHPVPSSPPPITPAPPPAPAPPPPPGAVPLTHTVQPGENLSEIARNINNWFGWPQGTITWQSIYAGNRDLIGPNPNLIYPGQVLIIS